MNKPFEVCLRLVLRLVTTAGVFNRRQGLQKKEKVSCKLGLKNYCES